MSYDDLPIEVRRANWGWFGEPYWSYACYDEAGKLLEDMRKPFPAGESCLHCGEPFDEGAGDSGQATPAYTAAGAEIRHAHKECAFRSAVGGLAHQDGRCSCHGGTAGPSGMSYRQEAVEVWRLMGAGEPFGKNHRSNQQETTTEEI